MRSICKECTNALVRGEMVSDVRPAVIRVGQAAHLGLDEAALKIAANAGDVAHVMTVAQQIVPFVHIDQAELVVDHLGEEELVVAQNGVTGVGVAANQRHN